MKEKYCRSCGTSIGNDNFCRNCGASNISQSIEKTERENVNAKKNGLSTKTLIVILLGIVLVFLVSGIVGMVMLSIPVNNDSFTNDTSDLMERYDFNNDGYIDFSEYKAMNYDAYRGNPPSDEQLEKNYNLIDYDGDGLLKENDLSFAEENWLNRAYESTK